MMEQEMVENGANESPLVAPSRLTSDVRLDFRRLVLEALEMADRNGLPFIELDLGATVEIDASGLGVLILLQKRARERGIMTRLHHVPNAVEQLLDSTRLGSLFEIVRP